MLLLVMLFFCFPCVAMAGQGDEYERGQTAFLNQKAPQHCDDARALIQRVDAVGGKPFLREIRSACWDLIVEHIASGKKDWLELAKKVDPFTDAYSAESLHQVALPSALLTSPALVLKMFGDDDARIQVICSADPSFDDSRSDEQVRHDVNSRLEKVKRALARVDSVNSDKVKKCQQFMAEDAKLIFKNISQH